MIKLFLALTFLHAFSFAAENDYSNELPVLPEEMMDLVASNAEYSVLKNLMITSKKMHQITCPYFFKDYLRSKPFGSTEKEIDISKVLDAANTGNMSDTEEIMVLMSIITRKLGQDPYDLCVKASKFSTASRILAQMQLNYSILPFFLDYISHYKGCEVIFTLAHFSAYDDLTLRMIQRAESEDYEGTSLALCERLIELRGRGAVVDACLAKLEESEAIRLFATLGSVELKGMDCISATSFPYRLSIALGGPANLFGYMRRIGASDEQLTHALSNWLRIQTFRLLGKFVLNLFAVFLELAHIPECKDACIGAFAEICEYARESEYRMLQVNSAIVKFIANTDHRHHGLISDILDGGLSPEELALLSA